MRTLQLSELAAYLPYKLPIRILNHKCDYVGIEYSNANGYYMLRDQFYVTYEGGSTGKSVSDFVPMLRPMSDLYMRHPVVMSLGIHIGADLCYLKDNPLNYSYDAVVELISHHLDVFGLIADNLAIDINSLNNDAWDNPGVA